MTRNRETATSFQASARERKAVLLRNICFQACCCRRNKMMKRPGSIDGMS